MCYLLSIFCLISSLVFVAQGLHVYTAFLIASVCFGMIFELSEKDSKNKWETFKNTFVNMSPEQLKEVTK